MGPESYGIQCECHCEAALWAQYTAAGATPRINLALRGTFENSWGVLWFQIIIFVGPTASQRENTELPLQLKKSFTITGHAALCYKPDGYGFETRWDEWIFFFNLPNPSGPIRPWGLLSH
jgi:hypothetical protein